MKKTFTINPFDHHILIEDENRTLLIDTGSPVTLFHGEEFEFLGTRVSKGLLPVSPDAIGELLGMHIDALVGCDLLKHFAVLFDCHQGTITFSDEELSLPDSECIPLSSTLGLPKVSLQMMGHDGRFFLDTGAKISYVKENVLNGLTPDGQDTDFYPGFGQFETPVYSVLTSIGHQEFTANYGVLPSLLETSLLSLTGTSGIIGYDFFSHFTVLLDLKNKTLLLKECANMSQNDILA